MKKNVLYTGAFLLLFGATVSAQTDSTKSEVPVTTTSTSTAEVPANYRPKSAELLPMPEALTTEKVFPVLGRYQVTDKDGASSEVVISQDPANKGLVWIEGLPAGKFKAYLKKSPAVYKIPAQELEPEVAAEEAVATDAVAATKATKAKKAKAPAKKTVAEGTLIYDKDANTINILIGTKYNDEDPAVAFVDPATTEEATATDATAKKTKKATAKTKVKPAKTWKYSGTKVIDAAASTTPATMTPAQ